MKKYSIFAAALSLAAIVSCQKEISENQQTTITPEIELESITLCTGDSQSKTSVSGQNIVWNEDDKIDIFSNADGYSKAYLLSTSKENVNVNGNGNTAKFSGEVAKGTTDFYAVYPSGSAKGVSNGMIYITVPTNQSPKADSFGEKMNVSVANGTKTLGNPQVSGVAFHNVCSYLKFTVPSYVPDVKKVEVTCDRAIAGSTVVNYTALESGSGTITGFGDANTITMEVEGEGSFAAGSTFWFVLTPGDVKSLTIKLTTSDGSKWERKSTKAFTLKVATPKNLGTIDFFPALGSANATHTKSGETTLTGTEVTVNLGLLSSMMSSVTAVNLQVTNGSGTVVRTYSSGTPEKNSVTIPADSSWPYLPQGSYTISGTYTVNGTPQKFTETDFTSPAPTFGVEVSAYTSYDKYLVHEITAANNCTAETIYDVSGKAMISESILVNANYASLVSALNSSYAYSVDNGTQSGNIFTDCAWGKRTLTANCTFDGATMSGTRACQITGLPYRPSNNSTEYSRWTGGSWSDSGISSSVTSGSKTPTPGYQFSETAYSPGFYAPNDISISFSAKIWAYGTICDLFLNTVRNTSSSSNGNTIDCSNKKWNDVSQELTLSASNIYVRVGKFPTYAWGINTVTILYK